MKLSYELLCSDVFTVKVKILLTTCLNLARRSSNRVQPSRLGLTCLNPSQPGPQSQSISWLCLNLSAGSVSIYQLALSQSISWHCLNLSAGTVSAGTVSAGSVSINQLALSQSISLLCLNLSTGTVLIYQLALSQLALAQLALS